MCSTNPCFCLCYKNCFLNGRSHRKIFFECINTYMVLMHALAGILQYCPPDATLLYLDPWPLTSPHYFFRSWRSTLKVWTPRWTPCPRWTSRSPRYRGRSHLPGQTWKGWSPGVTKLWKMPMLSGMTSPHWVSYLSLSLSKSEDAMASMM